MKQLKSIKLPVNPVTVDVTDSMSLYVKLLYKASCGDEMVWSLDTSESVAVQSQTCMYI